MGPLLGVILSAIGIKMPELVLAAINRWVCPRLRPHCS